jgi:hypothetical protein
MWPSSLPLDVGVTTNKVTHLALHAGLIRLGKVNFILVLKVLGYCNSLLDC